MRVWYYLLAAGVVFYAVCEFAELGEKAALGGRLRPSPRPPALSAKAPDVAPEQWRSAPASGERSAVKRGQGVLIEQTTGKRFQTR